MTTGEKIAKLRRENNFTQEQLADILGVSRQAISKWESDVTYPETEKLIRMSSLFNCSVDYLIKDNMEDDYKSNENSKEYPFSFFRKSFHERKSNKIVFGMPLWHVAKNAKGVFAVGINAKGIVAIGLKAKGIVALGGLSLGIISFGMLSLGLLSLGTLALGIFSAGCFSVGIFSAGAISLGIISLGAIAAGDFSVGALAIGKYVAIGDNARAAIALGDSQAVGTIYQSTAKLTAKNIAEVKNLIDTNVPSYLSFAKDIIKMFIG